MNDQEHPDGEAGWNCTTCGAPQAIASGLRFHRCSACGAIYRLSWRSGRLDTGAIRKLPPDVVGSQLDPELLRESLERQRIRLRELNDQIRKLEMSKGSERLSLLALFVLICVAVYALFKITVTGWESLLKPGQLELGMAAASAVSLLVLLLLQARRAAVVRQAQRLHIERDEAERNLESSEATLALRGLETGPSPPAQDSEPEEERQDIIGKFASRQRQKERKSRLGLRKRDEG